MKKNTILYFIIGYLLMFMDLAVTSCSDNNQNDQNTVALDSAETKPILIDGAWDLVWAKYNDTVQAIKNSSQFKHFSNGFFSLIAWDSTHKFSYAGYGKYELDGNLYKETFIYHDDPRYRGGEDWQQFELKGDTLYTKGFTKVIVGGNDVTADFPKIEEKRVRAK